MPILLTKPTISKIKSLERCSSEDIVSMVREIGEDPRIFFEDHDWSGIDFSLSDISNVSFRGADMSGVKIFEDQLDAVLASKPRLIDNPRIFSRSTITPVFDGPSDGNRNGIKFKWFEWSPWKFSSETNIDLIVDAIENAVLGRQGLPTSVRLLEAPGSLIKPPIPKDKRSEIVVHVLLGRGLLRQDTAFVMGFFWGCSSASTKLQRSMYKFTSSSRFFPRPFRFLESDIVSFDCGFDFARQVGSKVIDIHLFEFSKVLQQPIAKVRQAFGFTEADLIAAYKKEVSLNPNTKVSQRLPRSK